MGRQSVGKRDDVPEDDAMTERRCGTCRFARYVDARNEADGWRLCVPNLPVWVGLYQQGVAMTHGGNCPAWAEKETDDGV